MMCKKDGVCGKKKGLYRQGCPSRGSEGLTS